MPNSTTVVSRRIQPIHPPRLDTGWISDRSRKSHGDASQLMSSGIRIEGVAEQRPATRLSRRVRPPKSWNRISLPSPSRRAATSGEIAFRNPSLPGIPEADPCTPYQSPPDGCELNDTTTSVLFDPSPVMRGNSVSG